MLTPIPEESSTEFDNAREAVPEESSDDESQDSECSGSEVPNDLDQSMALLALQNSTVASSEGKISKWMSEVPSASNGSEEEDAFSCDGQGDSEETEFEGSEAEDDLSATHTEDDVNEESSTIGLALTTSREEEMFMKEDAAPGRDPGDPLPHVLSQGSAAKLRRDRIMRHEPWL